MALLLIVCCSAGALLLVAAGVEKAVFPASNYVSSRRSAAASQSLMAVGEMLLGGTALFLLWAPHTTKIGVPSWSGPLLGVCVFAALMMFAVVKGRYSPGAPCGCSSRLEVRLNGAFGVVTYRALVLICVNALYLASTLDLASPSVPSGLLVFLLSALAAWTLALLLYVFPYVVTIQDQSPATIRI